MAARTLTTKAVARALNVSVATIKRWADEGRLVAERTAGGHRRFHLEEVTRFQLAQQLLATGEGQAQQEDVAHQAAALRVAPAQFFEQLLTGEAEEVAALLVSACLGGASVPWLFDQWLCPAMRRIGELWYQGELSIAQEHLATRTALHAVYALRRAALPPQPSHLSAICGSVEDDYHELPVHLTQIVLESAGWRVVNFGASTPFFALAEAVRRHRPKLVCVSATVLYDLDYATHDYKEFRRVTTRQQAAVVLGGQGFSDETIRRRFAAELYAESFTKLAEFIKQMHHAR